MPTPSASIVRSWLSIALCAGFLVGCGGGGSGVGGGGQQAATSFSISGNVSAATGTPVAGVSVSLTGRAAATSTTDANGRYRFAGLSGGAYAVTPLLSGKSFSPASQSITINGANVVSTDFVVVAQVSLIGSGIEFLPATKSSADQLRASLAVSGGSAFFTDSSDVPLKKISLNTLAVTPLARRMNTPESVAIAGQNVYWVDGGRLNETSMDGTATTLLASGERDLIAGVTADLYVDGTSAYWVNTVGGLCSPSCTWVIRRVPLGGGSAVTLATVNQMVVALAGDADNIYWQEASSDALTSDCQCGSSIKRVPKAGGPADVLVDGFLNGTLPPAPPGQTLATWSPTGGLAVTRTQLIFGVIGNSFQLKSIPLAGGPIATLANVATSTSYALNTVRDISVSGDDVYWIDSGIRELDTVPVAGGPVTTLVGGLDLPSDPGHPIALAVTPTNAYWTELGALGGCCLRTETGAIKTVSLSGGTVSTFVGGIDAPRALTADSSNVVWADLWRVGKAALDGSLATTLASGISSDMARIAVDQSNVYVLDGELIKTVPREGGTLEKLSSAQGGNIGDFSQRNQDIATDGFSVYWTVGGVMSGPVVRKVPVSGGTVVTLSGGAVGRPQDCYWRIAVDSENVYWSSTTSAFPIGCTVRKVPIEGGPTTTLVDFDYLRDFTVDGTNVYFSELSGRSIRKVPISGGPSTTVATNVSAWVLTNDADSLYWVDIRGIGQFSKSAAGGAFSGTFLSGPVATDPFVAAEAIVIGPNGLFWTETILGEIYGIE